MLRVSQASQVPLALEETRQSTNLRSMSALVHLPKHRLTQAKPVFLVNPNRLIQLNSNQLVCLVRLKHLNLVRLVEVFSLRKECNLKTKLRVHLSLDHNLPRNLE